MILTLLNNRKADTRYTSCFAHLLESLIKAAVVAAFRATLTNQLTPFFNDGVKVE